MDAHPCGRRPVGSDRTDGRACSSTCTAVASRWSAARVGIGAPGPLDPQRGLIIHAPNMPGWVEIPLRDHIAQATGLPVVLGNDANAAALGEWRFGGGIGRRHMVYITVSTGIGGGVIVDGHLVEGRYGCGGELGFMVFDPVSGALWEDMASGTGLARAAERVLPDHPMSLLHALSAGGNVRAQHVALAAAQGDALALALMEREAELLGLGFASIMHIFSPEIILVGGSVITEIRSCSHGLLLGCESV
ncbi:ROK family protein [Candidatus Gracilibacteria bacterium]|nr:ROK family protein [Candidatus Gracilibacteria bacterium]